MEGAGCYGHNAAEDVVLDAVLLAKAAEGRPVRVQWSREGEMSHAPFGAAMAIEIEADLDANNEIVDWRHAIWSNGHVARPGRAPKPALLAGTEIANPFPRMISTNPPQANGGGGDRNSVPLYDFPSWTIESHRLLTMPVRTSALRTLGATGQCICDRVLSRRNRRRARRGPRRVSAASPEGRTRQGRDPRGSPASGLEAGQKSQASATASASRATRTPAPIAPRSRRSRGRKISGSGS